MTAPKALTYLIQPHRLPLVLLVVLGTWLRVANSGNVAGRTPDERVYTHHAKVWMQSGAAGIRSLVDEYKRDPLTRLYPPPTRVGIARLVALAIRLSGRSDEGVGATISCAFSIGSLIVAALIAARFLPPWGALFALLFYAVSPQELAIARRVWPDAIIELPAVLTVWFAFEVAAGGRRFWFVLFALAGAAGVAIRETFPSFCVFYLAWMLWTLAIDRRRRADAVLLVALSAAGMAASVLWLSSTIGSLSDFVHIATGMAAQNAVNAYALQYASGPPWLVLEAFWIASPLTALFAAAGLYAAFAARREKPYGHVFAGFAAATAVCLALMMSVPHYINLRYFSMMFGPVYLLAGYGFWYFGRLFANWLQARDRALVAAVAAAVILGSAVTDYLRFERFFVRDSLADLSIKMLQDERDR